MTKLPIKTLLTKSYFQLLQTLKCNGNLFSVKLPVNLLLQILKLFASAIFWYFLVETIPLFNNPTCFKNSPII